MPQAETVKRRPERNVLVSRIHIARKELALEEESYRAILRRITGHDSCSKLDAEQLRAVIAEFERLGLRPRVRRSVKPHVRKVYAVWGSMAGLVEDSGRGALHAFVLRQTGISSAEWLDGAQANKVIEGLKAWRKRMAEAADAV